MEVFLLGAGRPALGHKPSALKSITANTRAMDWQLHSFAVLGLNNISFLGGYHVEDVIQNYPHLKYQVVPDWQKHNVLHTLLQANFANDDFITAYSDTLFRTETIRAVTEQSADVVFVVDSCWKERYESRSIEDIESAETILLDGVEIEFTGLIYFSSNATAHLQKLEESDIGTTLVDLIKYFQKNDTFKTKHLDVAGQWTEFNSANDIAHFILGTKSETLARLEPLVQKSHIGSQVSFNTLDWSNKKAEVIAQIQSHFGDTKLVVRSSSKGEDNWHSSNAGGFESILNVDGSCTKAIENAVNEVITSFGSASNGEDQVLVQEFLTNVQCAGVVFTCDLESGAPYYRFNFDDKTQSTESVTAGTHSDLRTVLVNRSSSISLDNVAPELQPVLEAIQELEDLLGYDKLDIEFAISQDGNVHIFQVRPIVVNHDEHEFDAENVAYALTQAKNAFNQKQNASPFLLGDSAIFANMPDWNPAEIIGTRPKPLAFSLYRHLITNAVWAEQRAQFGYRNVNPAPLLHSFCGQPYIDCRASINSFIPATINDEAAERIVNAYIEILRANPQYHDKLEFDVLFTIWTPDFRTTAEKRLMPHGVTKEDIDQLELGLKQITSDSFIRLEKDIASINELAKRHKKIKQSSATTISKAYLMLEDCKTYGTLAFSHAARAGFVATTLLKSFVNIGILSDEKRLAFLKSFSTVAGEFSNDKHLFNEAHLTLADLVDKYGHLRPGTYDITTTAYWEDPEHYLISDTASNHHEEAFTFDAKELSEIEKVLDALGSDIGALGLVDYLIKATQAREFVKFEFTKNLSKALDYVSEFGNQHSLARAELAFLEFSDLKQLHLNALSISDIHKNIQQQKARYEITCAIELPQFISDENDIYCFERMASQPNFVTNNRVTGQLVKLDGQQASDLTDKIVLIPQADPGYDWLFGQNIKGLITQYGGANSHMAIRSAEIGLPAAIGVGAKLYDELSGYAQLELDCGNLVIRKIS